MPDAFPRSILCDASTPGVAGGYYVCPYNESVSGYRHGHRDPKTGTVRWTRSQAHPADARCPECARQEAPDA